MDITKCAKTLCHCPIDFLLFAILGEAEVWRMSLSEGAADPKVFILVLGSPVWNDLQETDFQTLSCPQFLYRAFTCGCLKPGKVTPDPSPKDHSS